MVSHSVSDGGALFLLSRLRMIFTLAGRGSMTPTSFLTEGLRSTCETFAGSASVSQGPLHRWMIVCSLVVIHHLLYASEPGAPGRYCNYLAKPFALVDITSIDTIPDRVLLLIEGVPSPCGQVRLLVYHAAMYIGKPREALRIYGYTLSEPGSIYSPNTIEKMVQTKRITVIAPPYFSRGCEEVAFPDDTAPVGRRRGAISIPAVKKTRKHEIASHRTLAMTGEEKV